MDILSSMENDFSEKKKTKPKAKFMAVSDKTASTESLTSKRESISSTSKDVQEVDVSRSIGREEREGENDLVGMDGTVEPNKHRQDWPNAVSSSYHNSSVITSNGSDDIGVGLGLGREGIEGGGGDSEREKGSNETKAAQCAPKVSDEGYKEGNHSLPEEGYGSYSVSSHSRRKSSATNDTSKRSVRFSDDLEEEKKQLSPPSGGPVVTRAKPIVGKFGIKKEEEKPEEKSGSSRSGRRSPPVSSPSLPFSDSDGGQRLEGFGEFPQDLTRSSELSQYRGKYDSATLEHPRFPWQNSTQNTAPELPSELFDDFFSKLKLSAVSSRPQSQIEASCASEGATVYSPIESPQDREDEGEGKDAMKALQRVDEAELALKKECTEHAQCKVRLLFYAIKIYCVRDGEEMGWGKPKEEWKLLVTPCCIDVVITVQELLMVAEKTVEKCLREQERLREEAQTHKDRASELETSKLKMKSELTAELEKSAVNVSRVRRDSVHIHDSV